MVRTDRSCAMFKGLPSSKILKQITRLNMIAGTPETAYILHPRITKVELFLIKMPRMGSAIGLRKFWRQNLPTLKFHNESVEFNINFIVTQSKEDHAKCPTKIVVHDKEGSLKEIDCSNKQVSEIFEDLLKITDATPVAKEDIPIISRDSSDRA